MSSASPAGSDSGPIPQEPVGLTTKNSILYSPAWMVGVGLVVRVAWITGELLSQLYKVPWPLFEMAAIGRSLALGHGFASPWGPSTGPTAWTAPLYPFVISLVFRVFGIYSLGAAFAMLIFNSVFSALTSWTMYRIASRLFNAKVAAWSGWVWALFPFAIFWSVIWIWETTLSGFLLSLLFMLTLEMDGETRLWPWFRYGLLWGVVALTNTGILVWLPFSGCWLVYRLYRAGKRFLGPAVLSAVVFWAVITPWLVRNYIVFDELVFIRSSLGCNLRIGNNPQAFGRWVPGYSCNNPAQMARYNQMGEVAFDAEQGRLARNWIAENPKKFLSLTWDRFFYFWYGLPETPLPQVGQVIFGCLTLLSFLGLLLGFRRRIHGLFLFATLLASYPLIYYVTFPMMRYRHPIEPEMVILAVWLLASETKPDKSELPEHRA